VARSIKDKINPERLDRNNLSSKLINKSYFSKKGGLIKKSINPKFEKFIPKRGKKDTQSMIPLIQ